MVGPATSCGSDAVGEHAGGDLVLCHAMLGSAGVDPFPNGNGRHARLAADILAVALGQKRFTWGSANLGERADARAAYIRALRAADDHDIDPLLAFARS